MLGINHSVWQVERTSSHQPVEAVRGGKNMVASSRAARCDPSAHDAGNSECFPLLRMSCRCKARSDQTHAPNLFLLHDMFLGRALLRVLWLWCWQLQLGRQQHVTHKWHMLSRDMPWVVVVLLLMCKVTVILIPYFIC
jgi:hypothetical protein